MSSSESSVSPPKRSEWRLTSKNSGEKEDAVDRYKQSQLLVERLEDELKNLKELSPTSEKHFFNMLQKEYIQIIDTMREKLKVVQERLSEELKSGNKKDGEIKILNEKLAELSKRFNEDEKELLSLKNTLKQEQEKNFHLKHELVETEKKLYYLQNKYQYINDLEEERDKLQCENVILSKDCNELEFALEVCHQRVDCYEQELQKMNKDLKLMINENIFTARKDTDLKHKVTELNDVILNLSSECNKINEDTNNWLSEKEDIDKGLNQTKIQLNAESRLDFFDKACDGVLELCKSVNRLKRTTMEYSKRNKELHAKLDSSHALVKKYRNRILKMNSIIAFLKQNLITLQKKLKVTTSRWQNETSEMISKMENRIQDLNKKYEEVKQENATIKKQRKKENIKDISKSSLLI